MIEKQCEGNSLLLIPDKRMLQSVTDGTVKSVTEKYKIYTAADARQISQIVQKELPDLIIADPDNSQINIRAIFHSIEDNKLSGSVPVLFVTSNLSLWDDIKNAAGTRITDIIGKPANITELLIRIEYLLMLSSMKSELESHRERSGRLTRKLNTAKTEIERLTVVASETENAVVIANDQAEIQWANDGFTRLFGYTIDEFTEIKGTSMLKASYNPNIKQVIKQCISLKKPVAYTMPSTTKSGKNIWVQTILTPVIDKNENIRNLVAIDQDITSLKLAEEAVKQQKEEIITQKEHIDRAGRELERLSLMARETKESADRMLEWKNIQITDSLNYAQRIQKAIFPSVTLFKKYCPDAFVLYRPKEVVSGDFYWYAKYDDNLFIAAIDCTGHGIPGAFMSLVGTTLLNEIVDKNNSLIPSGILDKFNRKVIDSLNKGEDDENVRYDGMDASLCRINKEKGEIHVASANQCVFIINDGKAISIEGDLYSIGGIFAKKPDAGFVDHFIRIEKQTSVYLFSDGYYNQLGGDENKKYMTARFKELLENIHDMDMQEQYKILNSEFDKWKGNRKQTDDVLVIGARISI